MMILLLCLLHAAKVAINAGIIFWSQLTDVRLSWFVTRTL